MEEEKKTLGYDWEFGHEELMLEVDAYRYDNRLYIGLTHMEEGYEQSFADLTINLAHMPVERNEAYIDAFASKSKLKSTNLERCFRKWVIRAWKVIIRWRLTLNAWRNLTRQE